MKFKRILAVLLSALMLTSMASFTVSAKEDAELTAEPVFEELAVSGKTAASHIYQTESGANTQQYDAANDIVYAHHVPKTGTDSQDKSFYPNLYGLSVDVSGVTDLWFVAYVRANLSGTPQCTSYNAVLTDGTKKELKFSAVDTGAYSGDGTWVKQMFQCTTDLTNIKTIVHIAYRPVGNHSASSLSEDTYTDVAYAAIFGDETSAKEYNPLERCSGKKITISFDAGEGEGEFNSYEAVSGKYASSTVTFPETEPTAPEGMAFNGWAASATGTPFDGDVATPDIDTTYYAVYKYVDDENTEYDDIYLQNVYYKLINENNLTIGYLGGSVTVGSGAENAGPNSTAAWRALTTQWFKDNFADAEITEVYAGIGGTGSRFGSYRMTRDLDLENNTIDLLFVDSCVNDQYEGFGYYDKDDLQGNDAVIVKKILENNPKCEIVFVNVPNNGTIKSADDAGAVKAHREFAEGNGFAFVDFKIAMARALTGNNEATYTEDISKWNDYYADSVHPSAAGYKVYFDYLNEVLLSDLVNQELTLSKAKYEDTEPTALDLETVDADRYLGGTANSNSAAGLNTITNYTLGQGNGFIGGNTISASAAGYSTTFKFTGKNALIWSNKHVENALIDVYVNDNTNIGSPDNTIDMWRNQKAENDAQNYLFPVLAEDLDVAEETTVTLVLRQNVSTEVRQEQLGEGTTAYDVGDALRNKISNIAIKGGTMDSVEFLEAPEAFRTDVEYADIVVPASGLKLAITSTAIPKSAVGYELTQYEGKDVVKTYWNGIDATSSFSTDGYNISNYGAVIGDYYNYATIYMYVDDPNNTTAGMKPMIRVLQYTGGNSDFVADAEIVPNAWQRISIDISDLEKKSTVALQAIKQYHFNYLGGAPAKNYPDVTIYAEKLVFSQTDPGDWADLDAKVTKLLVNGDAIEGFNKDTLEYTVELPYGTTEVPAITAETNVEATVTVVPAENLDGKTTVTLEGATDEDDVTYSIGFTIFDGIRLEGLYAGETEIALEEGRTEYQVVLPAGTTEIPEIKADLFGNTDKAVVTQAAALDGAATVVLTDGDNVTTYTITFYVLPSLAEKYPDAEIVYVSRSGAGTADGTSVENAAKDFKATLAAKANAQGQVVIALVDDAEITNNSELAIPKNLVITSAGGDIRTSSHPSFKASAGADIVIEDIDIYHTRSDGGQGEIYLVAKGNNLTLRNVNAIPYGEKDGVPRTVKLYVQPGGDGGSFTTTGNAKFEVYNCTGMTVRGGGYGGTSFNNGIDYVIGGTTALVDMIAGIQASGSSVQKTVDGAKQYDENGNPISNQSEDKRTVGGDINVTVQDNAKITTLAANNYGILKGDLTVTIKDNAGVDKVRFINSVAKASNQDGSDEEAVMSAGRLEGYGIVYLLDGKLNGVEGTQGKKRALVVNLNNAEKPTAITDVNHVVTYTGNGAVTVEYAEDGTASIALASETAQWAEITLPDGSVKKYDMATDQEVVLAHDMAIAITEGETAVVFNEGTGVTFKAYEADGAAADSTNTVTGIAGMTVPAPEAPTVKNEHFEFVGWALEGDETKTIVTDFGKFTDAAVTYVAIFKEAPAVQFKATEEAGASAAMDETIYGTTGAAVTAPEAPAAKENFTLLGWAKEGTSEIVTDFGTFADEKAVYVAIYDENPYAIFKATVEAGAAEALEAKVYGTIGNAVEAPAVTTKEHFTFKGWAREGTTEIVENIVYGDVDCTYVAIIEEDPRFTVTVYDGTEKVAEITDYTGFKYTFVKLGHTTTTRFLGYAAASDATEATVIAGDEITVTANATYYAVRKEIVLEDAEYTFYGEYDYSEQKYVIEMYYVGPKANMTAFGLAYPASAADFEVEYSDVLQSTGTHKLAGDGYYRDVLYPTQGGSFGDDMKTEVLVATITMSMTPEQYADKAYESVVKYSNPENITGAYANGEWQYIKNDASFSLDVEKRVYPIYFTDLADDKDVTITVTGVEPTITTVTAPTAGKMLEEIVFTAETAENEEPGLVAYYVDGVAIGELIAGDDGKTFTIPAEKVLGDVIIELSYGEPILEVTITDIEAPEAYGTPDTEATAGHATYTIDSVEWSPADAEFGFDTEYTVKVTVTADDEYAFTGKTVYTINGETATVKKVDIDTVELSYTFAPTVKELGTVSVKAGLVRDENNAAYANFGTIKVVDAAGTVAASFTEGTDAGNTLEAELSVLAGTYTVVIEKNGYLTYEEEIEVVYNKETKVETDLVAGNLYGTGVGTDNDEIDLADFVAVTSAFTSEATDETAAEAYRALVDIDEDGVVTVYDLLYIKVNFGAKAE